MVQRNNQNTSGNSTEGSSTDHNSQTMAPSGNRPLDDRVPVGADGHIQIVIGDQVIQSYDATNLEDGQRRDIASRILRYADSQTLGLKRTVAR